MNTSLTEEEKQIILQAESNRVSGGIYSEDGHRLLKVLGHQEHFEVKYGVTTICDGALGYHAYLRDVVLPTSVVNVGKCAFVHCPQLYKVEMQGVKYIGDMSFALCKSLTEVILLETVETIDNGAFACSRIEQINIPSHIKTIGLSAFRNTGLKSLVIEKSDDDSEKCMICRQAFKHCMQLKKVYLSKNVCLNDDTVFSDCPVLKTIEFDNPEVACK